MVVLPLNQDSPQSPAALRPPCCHRPNAITLASAGSLIAGAILILTGKRRAGMVAAASGTVLTALDQRETIRQWWQALPGTIEETQQILGKVQDAVHEVDVRRERLERIIHR